MNETQIKLFQKLATGSREEQASFLFFMLGYVTPGAIPNFGDALEGFYGNESKKLHQL